MTSSTLGFDGDRVAAIADQLFEMNEAKMSKARKPGGWSRKEILGHLIDSASVNHQRFIDSQITGSIVFIGYAHQEWVSLQGYRDAAWEELVTLWCALNMHLCNIVELIPSRVLDEVHNDHSYEAMAFRELPNDEPSTLGYLVEDYFAHLQYHLDQILE